MTKHAERTKAVETEDGTVYVAACKCGWEEDHWHVTKGAAKQDYREHRDVKEGA